MNQNVAKVAKSLFRQLLFWQLVIVAVSGAIGYGLSTVLPTMPSVASGGAFYTILSVLLTATWSKNAVKSTDFLARAILHVASTPNPEPSPDPGNVPSQRAFFEELAVSVYDLASQPKATQQTPTISTIDEFERNSPVPFIILDEKGIVQKTSGSAPEYLGLKSEELIGQQINDALKLFFSSEDTLENWLNFANERTVSLSRSWDRVKIIRPDESTIQFDLAAHFNKQSDNSSRVVLVFFDHTERYTKDDDGASFVAMAVHELRTPLTIMRGYIEVFDDELDGLLNSEQAEFMRNLTAQAQQLTSFVNNIQNLARIQESSLELALKQENWGECLNTTLNDLEIRAHARKRVIARDIPEDLPMVAVDRSTISEVIVNIVENAIKYTHTDDPITVKSYVKDGDWIETIVEDKGIGIPDSLIDHVFDKFYRSHRTSRSVGGTGLGLYICRAIIDAHGGQIWVKSKEGQGSTFGFTIPTYASVADQVKNTDNGSIIRGAHGWIKNHTLYRG